MGSDKPDVDSELVGWNKRDNPLDDNRDDNGLRLAIDQLDADFQRACTRHNDKQPNPDNPASAFVTVDCLGIPTWIVR